MQGEDVLTNQSVSISLSRPLKVLEPRHILEIDEALFQLGPFSEVRLIKVKGKLRFIQKVESVEFGDGKK